MGTSQQAGVPERFTREMGLTHAEVVRTLPPAIEHRPFTIEDDVVRIELDGRRVTIRLGAQRWRSIASLRVPYLSVTFAFEGFPDAERVQFMQRFERYFQRGGG